MFKIFVLSLLLNMSTSLIGDCIEALR